MPNKDGTANVGDALKHIGLALVGAILIYLTGAYLPNFLLIIIPPAICAGGGWLAGGVNPITKRNSAIAWGVIGLIAGIGFWAAQ